MPHWEYGISEESKTSAIHVSNMARYSCSRIGRQHVETFSAELILTAREFQIFERYVQSHLRAGNDWFRGPALSRGGINDAAILRIFNGDYTASPYGSVRNWRISTVLEHWANAQFLGQGQADGSFQVVSLAEDAALSLPEILAPAFWQIDGYSIKKATRNMRSEKYNGVARQCLVAYSYQDVISGSVILSESELATWESFFVDDLNHGAEAFNCPVWDGAGERSLSVNVDGSMYTKSQYGIANYKVDLSLIAERREPQNPAFLDRVIALGRELEEATGYIIDHEGNYLVDNNGNNIIYREFS